MSWITVFGSLLPGQVDAAGAESPATAAQIESVWDFVVKGGPMMVPILGASLIALAVIIERLVSLRRCRVIPDGFLAGLAGEMDVESGDRTAAIAYCEKNGSPVANIVGTGLKRLSEPIELLEKHIQEAGEREVFKLRRFLRLLAVIASVAPLMGLLGTIFGMIKAFQTVAMSGEALGKAELLAKGIYEAMITTAAGLLVAIPALISYHWIAARIDRLVSEMDQMTCEFVESYAGPAEAVVAAGPKLPSVEDKAEFDEDAGDQPEAATAVSCRR